jgi:hypothetical protein
MCGRNYSVRSRVEKTKNSQFDNYGRGRRYCNLRM